MSPLKTPALPILLLLFLSPFLTEVFTGSSPVYSFFTPIVFILFVTIGYGFPALILREIYVRKQLSLLSLFILGLGYGLWNEGLFAQTIFYPFHSPIESFSTYGLLANIRLPFALTISAWHALFAIIYPILFVNYLFKDQALKPWISKTTAWVLGIFSFAFGTIGFFINPRLAEFGDTTAQLTGSSHHFAFLVITTTILTLIAMLLPRGSNTSPVAQPTKKLLLRGVGLYVAVFFLPYLLASAGVPVLLFLAYFGLIFIAGAYLYMHSPTLTLKAKVIIALGGEICVALLGIFVAIITGQLLQAGFVTLCLIVCIGVVRWVQKAE